MPQSWTGAKIMGRIKELSGIWCPSDLTDQTITFWRNHLTMYLLFFILKKQLEAKVQETSVATSTLEVDAQIWSWPSRSSFTCRCWFLRKCPKFSAATCNLCILLFIIYFDLVLFVEILFLERPRSLLQQPRHWPSPSFVTGDVDSATCLRVWTGWATPTICHASPQKATRYPLIFYFSDFLVFFSAFIMCQMFISHNVLHEVNSIQWPMTDAWQAGRSKNTRTRDLFLRFEKICCSLSCVHCSLQLWRSCSSKHFRWASWTSATSLKLTLGYLVNFGWVFEFPKIIVGSKPFLFS